MAAKQQIGENYPPVVVTKTAPVYAKVLNPQQVLSLSNLDRQCPLLMYLVLFYKPCLALQNLSLDSIFSSLKSGLEETLSFWYPAAGRLRLNPYNGKLNLWCNNGGAVLVEAVSQVKISELGELSQYNEFFEKLVHKPEFHGDFSDMPLVVAQVTKFGCGGYSVGIGISHSLFDGPATYEFLSAWASHSAIIKQNNQLQSPVHQRGILVTQKNIPNLSIPATTRAAAIDHLYQLIKQATSDHHPNGRVQMQGFNSSKVVLKTFQLSGAAIERLKKKVFGDRRSSAGTTTFSCSSFELLAAHLWKARTEALGLKKETMVCLQFAVDTRNKTVPPLPKGFSGNAYVLASVAITVGELEQGSYKAIVGKIKEAKNSVNNEYVKAYIEALERQEQGSQSHQLPPLRELTLVSDWTKMAFHKVGFINREAVYASPLYPPVPHVAYFMQSPVDSGGVDVQIGLLPESVTIFSRYFLNCDR